MGLWDFFVDDVLAPVGGLIVDGVEATGRGIDTVVTTGIDIVGGGLDKVVEIVKEHPIETAAVVLTAGSGGLAATAARMAAGSAAGLAATGHVFENYVRSKVKPVVGSVVYCDLALVAEHSGIYVGKGKIAHLDGSGKIELVTARQFLKRLGGFNPAMSIYVSCNEGGAVGSARVGRLARAMAGGERSYNVILDNCHQFTSGCLTGTFDNADNFLMLLKHTAEKELNATEWKVWDLSR